MPSSKQFVDVQFAGVDLIARKRQLMEGGITVDQFLKTLPPADDTQLIKNAEAYFAQNETTSTGVSALDVLGCLIALQENTNQRLSQAAKDSFIAHYGFASTTTTEGFLKIGELFITPEEVGFAKTVLDKLKALKLLIESPKHAVLHVPPLGIKVWERLKQS